MYLESTTTTTVRTAIPIPFVSVSTFGTLLTRESRVNRDSPLTQSFRFVADKLFKLVETPIIEFPVKVFAFTFLDSDTCKIFKSNHIKGHIDYIFSNTMVNISHKPSFLSAHLLKKTFSRFGAFGLEFLPQMCIFGSCILNPAVIEKDIIRTNCNVDNPSVNTKNSVPDWLRRFCSKCDMQIEQIVSAIIVQIRTSNFPFEILFVIFRNCKANLNSAVNRRNRSIPVFENNTDCILVVSDSRERRTSWKGLELDTLKSFTRNIPSTLNVRGIEVRMPFSNVFVSSVMDRNFGMGPVPETILCNLVKNLVEKYNCILETFFVFLRHLKFQFNRPIHIHILHSIGNKNNDTKKRRYSIMANTNTPSSPTLRKESPVGL
jgi:hypothetical protein